ncbi:hypothetical protein KJZ63_01620 [Patescibacteria group bacterium]|nr:hypothetical protein [Patescibacteria group bacterium]
MKTKKAGSNQLKNSVFKVGKVVSILLLAAFLGNFTVDSWNWGVMDFVIMGTLLFVAGIGIDLTIRKFANPFHRLMLILGIVALFLLVWTELAVDVVSKLVEFVF